MSRSHFLKPVVPGDALRIKVEVERMYKKAAMVKARGEVDGEVVLKASLSFVGVDRASIQRLRTVSAPSVARIGL